ncbi:response regulator transcription factor [Myroides sp. NP-2]|uniref:response regulator transcription factor n=1 Tax=Myroides sp. NP-2 TaxID=2759945 RepID=UPI0015FA46F7|nr:response regulator transcription factor [Myroides sp. NP-2]MBB1150450.1 response regulator transcription factor [Myroides sp. NP-2]
MKYKITLVEDDTLIRELLTEFLNASKDFEVCYSFGGSSNLYELVMSHCSKMDLIIMDFQLGDKHMEELLVHLKQAAFGVPIVIVTTQYNPVLIEYMMNLGVSCYLPKNIKLREFLILLYEVVQKGHYLDKEQFTYLKEAVYDHAEASTLKQFNISKREVDILYLLAQQYTAKEIGKRLFISPKTVENYKSVLFVKTGTKSIVGLVLWAIHRRIISVDSR